MRIIHLSDVHIQIDYRRVPLARLGWRRALAQLELQLMRRAERYENALATLSQIARDAEALAADHVLLTGDLTALATHEEFEQARSALGALANDPQRLSIIPGNHDRYTAGATAERRFESYFASLLGSDLPQYAGRHGYPYVRLVGDWLAVVGLDSTRLAPLPGLAFGHVGRDQLRRLSRLLEDPALAGRAVCVLVHHAPLHVDGKPDRVTHGLLDAVALLRLLAGRPNVSLHHGHVHHRYRHSANDRRPAVFNAGSSTQRGDEGYWVIDVEDDRVCSARMERPGRVPLAGHASTPAAPEPLSRQ